MSKFHKKPVVIEAVQWWMSGDHPAVVADERSPTGFAILTLENTAVKHEVSAGDWIVTGVAGENYPVKPEIFAATYASAPADAALGSEYPPPAERAAEPEARYIVVGGEVRNYASAAEAVAAEQARAAHRPLFDACLVLEARIVGEIAPSVKHVAGGGAWPDADTGEIREDDLAGLKARKLRAYPGADKDAFTAANRKGALFGAGQTLRDAMKASD